MDQHRRSLQLGAAAIACAILLRLGGSGFFQPVVQALTRPETAAFLLYLETGRIVHPEASVPETTAPTAATDATAAQTEATVSPAARPVFSPEDAAGISITYNCSYRPDIAALLGSPLSWELAGEEPTVLILHTHATESYTPTADQTYTESSAFRTLDEGYNMLAIGDRVAQILTDGGITVIHDRTFHDHPSYSGSYAAARETIAEYLSQYPSIRLILDLHRDAAEDAQGRQIATAADVDGEESAQLMLVMGSDAGGLDYPNWQENFSLALKLQCQLEKENPGLCRPMNFCAQRYNQDMCPGALLVEVGAAGNTQAQALTAAEALAEGILALSHGTGQDG